MNTSPFRVLTGEQARRRATFQRQLLTDVHEYLRKSGALPQATRRGLEKLQTTLSRNIKELDFRSVRGSNWGETSR